MWFGIDRGGGKKYKYLTSPVSDVSKDNEENQSIDVARILTTKLNIEYNLFFR